MSDDKVADAGIGAADPQHHANPQYNGNDHLVLAFIKKREETLAKVAEIQRSQPPRPNTTIELREDQVAADIGGSNAQYAAGALKREIMNSYYNHPLIMEDFAAGRASNLDPRQPGNAGPALIIGSGPTLDRNHDLIRGWNGGIFCSSSQCRAMVALGKKSFNIVAVDVKTLSNEFTPMNIWGDVGANLILHPGMDPEVIHEWRWRKQYFRIIVHGMPFYTEMLPIAYPMIRTTMYVYGCVASAQIMIANLLGYGPLFLIGCDFGYEGNQARFTDFNRTADGKWELAEKSGPPQFTLHPKVTFRNGVVSDHFQAYYKQTFFNAWRLTLADIFRVGPGGGLYEVPEISKERLSQTQGALEASDFVLSNRDKQDISERYLLQFGTYTFEFPNGQVEFVLFKNPEVEIPQYLEMVNNMFRQQRMPGVLLLGEEKSRLDYLRNDEAWARKEQRWQWAIKSPQSLTENPPDSNSPSA
jgi:hypothetical protein